MKAKESKNLILLFMFVYFVSYVTRTNYGAIVSEIIRSEHIAAALASFAISGSAITYGIGQLLSGYTGDKMQPRRLVLCGLLVTALMNLLLPFCHTPYQMAIVWCINGLAQAFMWPPLVCLMAELFDEETYQIACVLVSFGGSFGTILIYLMSPVLIGLMGWRSVFILSSLTALLMAAVWYKKCPILPRNKTAHTNKPTQCTEKEFAEMSAQKQGNPAGSATLFSRIPYLLLLTGILLAILLQGMLRDGVTTWMPSYISDTFHLDSRISILSGVILPIFSVLAFQLTSLLYRKAIHNEVTLAATLFLTGFGAALLLFFFHGTNTFATISLFALLTGSMHGINLVLTCMVPRHFAKHGHISFISGLFNFFAYIGSAVSTYGMAAISDAYGWSSLITLWCILTLAGGILCLILVNGWRRFVKAD